MEAVPGIVIGPKMAWDDFVWVSWVNLALVRKHVDCRNEWKLAVYIYIYIYTDSIFISSLNDEKRRNPI